MGNENKVKGIIVKKKCLKSVVFIVILFFLPAVLSAEQAAVIVSLKGSVQISQDGKTGWKKAASGMSVPEGWYVKVGEDSQAALMLKDRSQIRLRDNSLICLNQSGSAPEEKKQKKGFFSFLLGEFWMRNKRKVIKPDIKTKSFNMSIRGTELRVVVTPDGKTLATALEGKVLCENQQGAAVISRGTEARAGEDKAIETYRIINPENSVQWLLVTLNVVGPADKAPVSPDAVKAKQLSIESMRLLAENKVEKAHEKASAAVKLIPDMACANIAMATVIQARGRFEKALTFARKGLKNDPASEPALLRNTELLLGLDQTLKAQHVLNNFKGEMSNLSLMLKGYLHLLKKEFKTAQKAFERSIAVNRDVSRAWLGLGLALYAGGKIDQGLEKMEIASLLNPLSAFPHNHLGKALYQVKEYKEAENEFVRASQLDPNDPTPYLYLSILAQDNFQPAQSIRSLKKAIDMNDNRFVSRSRFLLDADRSIKNINLASSLSWLGLNEWSRHIGNKAVWQDNANSSAYMFRAGESLLLSRVDVATLSDLKRAELLKPVNSNTYASFTDYYTLLELPEHDQTLEVYGGTDQTFGSALTLTGGKSKFSYLASAGFDTSDGPFDNTGSSDKYLDIQYKTEPVFNHQFSLGLLGGKGNYEDQRPLQNGFALPASDDTDYDYYKLDAGYHWNMSSSQDLMVSLQYQDRDSNAFKQREMTTAYGSSFNWLDSLCQDDKRYRAEIADLIKFKNHQFSFGGVLGRRERQVDNVQKFQFSFPVSKTSSLSSSKDPEETEARFFAKDLLNVSDQLTLDLGLGWCRFDADGKNDISRWLPQAGAVWHFNENNLFRAAYFREIQPDYLSSTLQPVEVAGFSTVTGVPSGTLTQSFGFAFERQWGSRYFAGIDIQEKEKQYNSPYLPHPDLTDAWMEEDSRSLGLTFEYLLSDNYALSFTQRFKNIEPETPGFDRDVSETGVKLTCVYPFGLTFQTAWWFVDQQFDDASAAGINGDSFIIGSISARQSLYNKKLELFLTMDNILDKKYNYVPAEPAETLQLPWQALFFMAGLRVNF